MIKFNINPTRFAEACGAWEYLLVQRGNMEASIRCLPRFVLDKDGSYVVKIELDEDGDIASAENEQLARLAMAAITPKRLEKLSKELMEAAKAIVDPPK